MKFGRFVFWMLVLAAAAGGGWWWYVQNVEGQKTETARQPGRRGRGGGGDPDEVVTVTAALVRQQTVPVLREGIGNVQANALVTVRAQIDGRLLEVGFREGEEVRKGDVLARIDPAPSQAALDQALAKLSQDQATLANARIDLERYERLAATNAGPRQQADQQRALVAQLEAQVRADQAAVDAARINVGYTTITAPITGRAGLRQVDAGNIIRASDANGLVTLAQVRPIAVLFTLPQRDLAITKQALAAGAAQVEALETDGRTVLARGVLDVIDNQVDQATGTIKLKASFPNDDMRLWPGQFVTVRVRVAEIANARVVPTPALRRGPSGIFVYVVDAEERALVRPVTVTQQDEMIAVVASGLQAGERVVTAGFQRLSDGKPVSVAAEPGVGDPAAPAVQPRQRGEGRGGGRRPADSPAQPQSTPPTAPSAQQSPEAPPAPAPTSPAQTSAQPQGRQGS